jgi:GNAT superfamily N-acetyltransferase
MEITKVRDGDYVSFKAKLGERTIGECDTRPDQYPSTTYMGKTRPFQLHSDKNFYVSWLGVNEGYKGRYVGTRLLYRALRYYHRRGYRYVTLMDASKYSGKIKSIYRQIGLSYSKDMDGDESNYMIGNIRHILFGKFRGMNGKNKRNDRFYRRKEIISSI